MGRNYCSACLREVSIFILLLSWKLDAHNIRSWTRIVCSGAVPHNYLRNKRVGSISCVDLIVSRHRNSAIINGLWNTTCRHHSVSPLTVIVALAMCDWYRSCHHIWVLHLGFHTTTPFWSICLVYSQGLSPMINHWWQIPRLFVVV